MTIDQSLLNAAEAVAASATGLETVVVTQLQTIKDQTQTFSNQALTHAASWQAMTHICH